MTEQNPASTTGAAGSPEPRRQSWGQLWKILGPALSDFRGRTLAALLLLVISKLAFVAVPWLLKQIVDALSRPEQLILLPVFLLLGYALLRFAGTLFGELRDVVFARVMRATVSRYTVQVFEHLQKLGPRFHVQRQTGGVIRDIERGTTAIGFLLGVALFTILPTLVEIGGVLAIMLSQYRVPFSAIIFATFAAYVGTTLALAGRRLPLVKQLNQLDSEGNARLVDSLLNFETVHAHANEPYEAERLKAIFGRWSDVGVSNQRALSLLHVGQSGVIALGVAAVMLYAAQEVVLGRLTVGDLVLINAYVIQVCLPLNALGFVFREARDAMISLERLFDLLRQPPEIVERATLPALKVDGGEICFEHVDFGYEPARPVLHDVSFRIAPGGTLAVVGGSGSGKSTLARLLLRFYETQAGRVLIDGQEIRGVTQKSLRQAIGVVPQDTTLFNETIAYNIGYGRIGAGLAEIIDAAKAAHVHDFIINLPDQYQARVGERGLKLSGGEKQRISIARAILKNPPILVFDEATSALDTRSERAIQTELERISRDRTTLIIAHRLSTIVDADEILVLEHGRVVERGRHAALLAQGGVYEQMWRLQQSQQELEHVEQRLALQAVNLATLAAGVIDGLRPVIEARRIRLYSSLDIEDARVTGDPSLLHQVIWELVANAIDLTPDGGRVELDIDRLGADVRLRVADSRHTMLAGTPAAAADPALRALRAPLDPLRIRGIVEQHRGRFELLPASAAEGGRQIVDLPLRAVAAMPLISGGEAKFDGSDGAPPASLLAGLTVMTVDDDPAAREALAALLETAGAEVREIASGQAALAWLASVDTADWPQVLLCDIALGEESGYDVLRDLRALEAARATRLEDRLPAIALTGHAAPEDRIRALLAGFQIHLAKPVDPKELLTTVAALAGDSRCGRPAPAALPEPAR